MITETSNFKNLFWSQRTSKSVFILATLVNSNSFKIFFCVVFDRLFIVSMLIIRQIIIVVSIIVLLTKHLLITRFLNPRLSTVGCFRSWKLAYWTLVFRVCSLGTHFRIVIRFLFFINHLFRLASRNIKTSSYLLSLCFHLIDILILIKTFNFKLSIIFRMQGFWGFGVLGFRVRVRVRV